MSRSVIRSAADDGTPLPPVAVPSADPVGPRGATVIDTRRLTYTVDEAARLLGLSRGIAYQYVRDGVIPAQRVGRRWLIPRERLHAWLDGKAVA
jgi:excisionase family DNA binding protein